jgi:predicted RNA-binding Zn-ribbon protein involved in translation (DUF1610 family)
MKRCSQCGKEVPDSAMVGQRCPRCGLTWQAERKDTYTYKKPKQKSGCTWWIIIIVILMAITMALPKMVKLKIPINENRVISQWLSMNIDSVVISKQLILHLTAAQRDSVFRHISVKYAKAIDNEAGQSKINLIVFTTRIDSVFSDPSLNFRFIYPNAIYKKLIDISANPDLLQNIRKNADSTLQVLNLK